MGLFKDCGCGCNGRKQQDKFVISIISALVFFIVASPELYQLTRNIFGSWISGPTGCASTAGLALHAVVFMLITWGLMNLRREAKKDDSSCGCGK